jgi:acyl carrier protein
VSNTPLTRDDIVGMTKLFLAEQGFGDLDVTVDSKLEDLGLDSITAVLMLTSHKSAMVEAGHPLPGDEQPPTGIFTVGDLADHLLAGSSA